MKTVGIIQARMGSNRLPGKMMLPLDGIPVIEHIVRRVAEAPAIDEVVVATSTDIKDDIIAQTLEGTELVSAVFRGSESDVLRRMYDAATACGANVVVRMCGDRPLIPPPLIDQAAKLIESENLDYVGNMDVNSFPTGFGVEAFSMESFRQVEEESTSKIEREHVTPYYRTNQEAFRTGELYPDEVFQSQILCECNELRLTLDEAADYELLSAVYNGVEFDHTLPATNAIRYINEHSLSSINQSVDQKVI